jgi:hypothetical protein
VVTVGRGIDDDTVGVIALSPGEHFSETNESLGTVLLVYGAARVLLAGHAEEGSNTWQATPTPGP